MNSMRRSTVMVMAFAVACLFAGRTKAGSETHVPKLDLHETKLPNGLRVIIVRDPSAPVYAICVTYNVGSRNERPGHTGFAHLFEHMMFEGSENVGKGEHYALIYNNGGTMNGTTNEDRTDYFEELPSNQLDLGLYLESDRMRSLKITEENFENQRKTVEEERRQTDDNEAYGRTSIEIDNLSYDNFAYKHSTIGSISDLDRATLEEAAEFFSTYYAPNNAVLTLVGDLDPDEALAKVKKYFGSIPARSIPPTVGLDEEAHEGERRETMYDPLARLPEIDIAYHLPPGNTPENYAGRELAMILGQSESSRLYQHLVKDQQLASEVSVSAESRIGASPFYISANPRPGVKVEDLERAVDLEIAAIVKDGVTPQELAKVQKQLLRSYIDRRRSVYSTARLIGDYSVYFDDPDLINTLLDKQQSVTVDQVNSVARKYLIASQRAVVITLPGGPVRPPTTGSAAQTEGNPATGKVVRLNRAPVSKEVLRVKLPRPTLVTLPSGLRVELLEDHKLPTVAFRLWIRPGHLGDPKDSPGLASFTADMLREGTERRTSAQIAAEVDSLGASLDAEAYYGASYTSVSASGLTSDASEILDLMSDVVLHPAFGPEEVGKYKQRAQADLEENLSDPGFLGRQALRGALYGDTPMSVTSPTEQSVKKITPEDLRRFHDQHYHPGNAILGVTGDFKADDMRALIQKYFGSWEGAAEPPFAVASTGPAEPLKIIIVDRPGSVQTFIEGGDRAIARTDPGYYGLEVMNEILGGGPQARLFVDLREEHGYTYGAYSRFDAEVYPGDWLSEASVRTAVTSPSFERFLYELGKIRTEAVLQAEIDDAHRSIIGSFARSLSRPDELLDDWLTVEHFGLPMDYWDTYPDHIAAIDSSAVKAAAQNYVDLEHLQWVTVGDAAQIKDGLAKYGPVTVVGAPRKQQ
jgi:zinc protease